MATQNTIFDFEAIHLFWTAAEDLLKSMGVRGEG